MAYRGVAAHRESASLPGRGDFVLHAAAFTLVLAVRVGQKLEAVKLPLKGLALMRLDPTLRRLGQLISCVACALLPTGCSQYSEAATKGMCELLQYSKQFLCGALVKAQLHAVLGTHTRCDV